MRILLRGTWRSWVVLLLFDGGWLTMTWGIAHRDWRVWVISLGLLAWAHAAMIFIVMLSKGDRT
jgi:hypothetical protein